MKNINKNQRCREFPQICKLLSTLHSKLQSHSKTTEWIKRQEGLEIGRGIPESIRRTQRKDHKSTSSFFTQKRRKIQSGNKCLRTCYRRSTIPRVGGEIETHSFLIKNNATSRTKLRDLQQETTSNSRSSHKMETIPIGYSRTFWSLDRL